MDGIVPVQAILVSGASGCASEAHQSKLIGGVSGNEPSPLKVVQLGEGESAGEKECE